MKRLTILLFLILPIVALMAGTVKLQDNESVQGKELKFENNSIILDNKKIDREEAKKLILSETRADVTAKPSEYGIVKGDVEQYRKVAKELEDKYPDANSVGIYFKQRSILTSDKREVEIIHSVRKVLTQEATTMANHSWYIDEGINRTIILIARAIAPDGTVFEFSPDDISWSEPSRDMVFFGEGEIMSLTVPSVDVGYIVEVAYVRETYSSEDPELFQVAYPFQGSEPSKYDCLLVEIPKDRELYYTTQYLDDYFADNWVSNIETVKLPECKIENPKRPIITETDSSKIYSWEMKDIQPMVSEVSMPSYQNVAPMVFAGLYPDFSYYFKRFGDLHREHMKITPTLDSLAKSIVGDAQTDSAKVARLYHWVQRNIRYISVKGALASSFGGHYAQITYDNKYGDCSDKAVFFATLCKVVGIEAYPIILLTNDAGFLDREKFPFWGGNHAINEVWIEGKKYVLDATNNNHRFPYYVSGDTDIWYVNYVTGNVVFNPPVLPVNNAWTTVSEVILSNEGGAEIVDSMVFTGDYEAGFRGWFEQTPEGQHKMIAENISSSWVPGSELEDYSVNNVEEIENPFVFNMKYKVDDYLIKAGDYYLLKVPALGYRFPEIALKERNYPIKTDDAARRSHDVVFTIPDGFEVEFVPNTISVSNKYFEYEASYTKEGNTIHFRDRFDRKEIRIPVEAYEQYKQDAEKIMAYTKEKIFLKKS